jgi:hypothetical protein
MNAFSKIDMGEDGSAARRHHFTAIEPIDIRQHGVDSRGVAVAGEGWGCCGKETGMTALPPLRGKIGSPTLELPVSLAVLADGVRW